MATDKNIVIALMCERSVDVNDVLNKDGTVQGVDGLNVIKIPCSGMAQPVMIENALKAGASGVVVCGCQIGDCYYREGNKMIRERLLGNRPPMLKKATDRRRVLALWLSRPQKERFLTEARDFAKFVNELPAPEPAAAPAAAKPAAAATTATASAAAAPAAAAKPAEKAEEKTAEEKAAKEIAKADAAAAAEPKLAGETVDAAKVDNTKEVKTAGADSNDKDVKVEVDTPPIPEGRGPLESTGDATSST